MLHKPKVASLFINDALSTKTYKESVALRMKGKWRDAGDKLFECARLHGILKMQLESATLYTEAAECFMKIDKGEALQAYYTSIRIYCDIGRFDIAGKLERKVADINFQAKHYDEAAVHYRKAGNFLSGDMLLDQSDHCMARCAECLLLLGEYQEASQLFRIVATSCVNTNLRRFNAKDYWFRSLLCILGLPVYDPEKPDGPKPVRGTSKIVFEDSDEKYTYLLEQSDSIDHVDFMWKGCVEKRFIENIAVARHKGDQHDLIDQIYYWNQIKPLDAIGLKLVKTLYDEIIEEIEYQKREIENKHARMQADAGSVHSLNTSVSGQSSITSAPPVANGSGSFTVPGANSPKTSVNMQQEGGHNNSFMTTPSGKTSISGIK